jgi:peroxiredoxin
MELPEIVDPKKPITNGGALFPMQMIDVNGFEEGGGRPANDALIKLFEKLDATDKSIVGLRKEGNPKRNAVRLATLHKEKALAGIEIFKEVEADQRLSWLQNVTDNVADAYRAEEFPTGLSFLNDFSNQLSRSKITQGLDYIRWRSIYAEYSLKLKIASSQGRKQATTKLMVELQNFYKRFPKSEFAPEALHQLGQNNEVDEGDPAKAIQWYQELARKFPKTAYGRRAQGALNRINGKGRSVPFKGKTSTGKTFDLSASALRGKIVVLHFWDSQSTTGFKELQKLNAKWEDEVVVVGANIDEKTEDFSAFMKENRAINWTQLHAPGGMDKSSLAIQVGLVAQPLAMIFDKEGKMVEDNISFGDLEREVQRILRADNK